MTEVIGAQLPWTGAAALKDSPSSELSSSRGRASPSPLLDGNLASVTTAGPVLLAGTW